MATTCPPSNGRANVQPYHGFREFQEDWPAEKLGVRVLSIETKSRRGLPDSKDYSRNKAGFELYVRDLTQYFMVKTLESREWKDLVRNEATNLFRDHIEYLVDEKIKLALDELERTLKENIEQEATATPDYAYLNLEAQVRVPDSLNWDTVPREDGMYPDLTTFVYDWDAEEVE